MAKGKRGKAASGGAKGTGGAGAGLVRGVPGALSAQETELLEELLEAGRQTEDAVEDALLSFGRLVYRRLFGSKLAALKDEKTSPNRVWRELRRRAGGPTLKLDDKTVSVCVRIAAWDKAINDEAFRGLDLERKSRLLPLDDADQLRESAQHVAAHKLSLRATERYVRSLRAAKGKAAKARFTPARLSSGLGRVRETFGSPAARSAIAKTIARMTPDERRSSQREVDEAIAALRHLRTQLGE